VDEDRGAVAVSAAAAGTTERANLMLRRLRGARGLRCASRSRTSVGFRLVSSRRSRVVFVAVFASSYHVGTYIIYYIILYTEIINVRGAQPDTATAFLSDFQLRRQGSLLHSGSTFFSRSLCTIYVNIKKSLK